MQPQKLPYRNPACPTCNHDLENREWRVRSETNYGESWHPRCFIATWPTIDIQCPPDTPPEISSLIQNGRRQPEPTPMDQSSTTPPNANTATPPNTPESPNERETLPPLHGWQDIDWETILEQTPTAKHIPPQCQAMYIQLILHICNHINHHTAQGNCTDATNGIKLLLATPKMVFSNTHKHRAGQQKQGSASLTKTVRQRINAIYNSRWDELLTEPRNLINRSKSQPTNQK